MRVIAVDDEPLALKNLEHVLSEFPEMEQVTSFQSSLAALEWMKDNEVDVALLDINMRQIDGLSMAKQVKMACPSCSIIFVTGYSEYALEAIRMHVSGYLLKPVQKEELRREIEYINRKPLLPPKGGKQLRVQCFGNFEVFFDDKPVVFGRRKAKELLAYLVDRKGAVVTIAEATAVLYEDKEYNRSLQSQVQTVISDMMKSLRAVQAEEIVIKNRNSLAVDVNAFDCDYYDFMRGDVRAINAFSNEYMSNYSWTEFTAGALIERTEKL